ncbi:shikimate kinase AroK [Hydrocarboniclastica marina]|uniref:Shikimate kinase n=1 Tax=Hydrocarboniclastica marina TaxID=2259620 RepID=A0A4P7XKN6_9ALTE|nr:shikimate kinase AroK [Hydrocarboniclastica marina]MAL99511.1 shikimate kinase AroK [Alteromonadaceae bacterium]QCF27799.1 shikimate kinase AroK [Hydrocarboniclastica marina]
MMIPERIVLVGPMGAGKSTIGRLLAKELGFRFLDSDKVIEERCGASIPWIFDVEGEAGFRRRETAILQELSQETQVVIATGGGAVTREENRACLKRGAFVIYLRTSLEQQYDRTRRDRNRPLLQKPNPRAILEALFAERDPLYQELADFVMYTDRKSPRLVARQLLNQIRPRVQRKKKQA